jgi:serine/threonine-protein kinase
MRKLRVALDDVGEVPRYIETLPRVGYRFIGRGAAATASPPPTRPTPRGGFALMLGLLALAAAVAVGWWIGMDSSVRGASAAPMKSRHVPGVRAQELYLDGLHQRSRRDIDANNLALQKFEAALGEDPGYPEAWAAYGETMSGTVIRLKLPPAEGVPKARAAAQRAIALDPGLADGHNALAQIAMDFDKDFVVARRELDRAMQLDDKYSRLWHNLAMWHGHQGHLDEAFAAIRTARQIEPMRLLFVGNYGLLLYQARRYEEAIAFLRPVAEANPKFDNAHAVLARALMATGDLAGALEQQRAREYPGMSQGDLGVLYARMGQREDALREIEGLEQRRRRGYGLSYDQALIYVALGDFDKACEKLARAVTDYSLLVNWMRLEPQLDPLRDRQCFADAEHRLYAEKGPAP